MSVAPYQKPFKQKCLNCWSDIWNSQKGVHYCEQCGKEIINMVKTIPLEVVKKKIVSHQLKTNELILDNS